MTAETVTLDDPPLLLDQFLTGYWSPRTRANYAFIIGGWFTWCASHEHVRCATPTRSRPAICCGDQLLQHPLDLGT